MSPEQWWKLSVDIKIEEVDEPGNYSGRFPRGQALTIRHELEIGSGNFMQACRILSQFDELARKSQMRKDAE